MCVSFDLPGPTFRNELYEGYKAGRKPMPDELAAQLAPTREVLKALRIPVYELAGFEADDILGTVSRICAERGVTCSIVTGDRDSFQLIGGGVRVLHVGNKETRVCTGETVMADYGLTPAQLIDLKALMGDTSDQIPGVPGVGEKTALALMHEWGSLDAIYENIDKIPEKYAKKLIPGRDSAYLSRKLGEIDRNVPIEFSPEAARRRKPDEVLLDDIFARLEFGRIAARWRKAPPLPGGTEVFSDDSGDNLSLFPAELELPDGVGSDIKSVWRDEMAAGRPLTPYKYDAALAAWMLQTPEAPWEVMREKMEAQGLWKLYTEVEMPLSLVLAEMECRGIAVDRARLEDYGKMLAGRLADTEARIFEAAGKSFVINSPKQLGELLFETLGLPHGRKTKTGWSTDADTLDGLRDAHPVVPLVLEYRTLSKLKSTYTDGLLKVMDSGGRIHSTFQMTATVTGRLSSTEPNLQNIPVRTELGGRLREMFVPGKPGWVLVDADYSQIELRVLAYIACDEVMQAAFAAGEDIHAVTASQVFGVRPAEVTQAMRRAAKAVNFGIVYGISDFSLAADIGVPRWEAKQYIENYLEKYAGVRAYMSDIIKQAHADGYVTTLFGRRRQIPELASRNANIRKFGERAALNTPIQGTAADIIKMAMVAVRNRLEREGLEARLVLQVHDELIVECPEAEAGRVAALLSEEMTGVFPMNPPLAADAHFGKSWADAKG